MRPMAQVRHDQKKKNKKILSLGVEKGRTSRLEKLWSLDVGETVGWVKDDLQGSSMNERTTCCYELRETRSGFRGKMQTESSALDVGSLWGAYGACRWSKALAPTEAVTENKQTPGLYHVFKPCVISRDGGAGRRNLVNLSTSRASRT